MSTLLLLFLPLCIAIYAYSQSVLLSLVVSMLVSFAAVLARHYRAHQRAIAALSHIPGRSFFSELLLIAMRPKEHYMLDPEALLQRTKAEIVSDSSAVCSWPGLRRLTIGDTNYVITADPELMKQVMIQKYKIFNKPELVRRPLIGQGVKRQTIFSAHPSENWLELKKLLAPAFADNSLKEISEQWIEHQTNELLQLWQEQIKANGGAKATVNAQRDMYNLALDIITSAGFSEDVKTLHGGASGRRLLYCISVIMQNVLVGSALSSLMPFWLIDLMSKIPGFPGLNRIGTVTRSYFDYLRGMIQRQKKNEAARSSNNLVARMIAAEDRGLRLDEEDLLVNSSVLYAAGTETSANTMSWALLFMAAKPEIQTRARAEVEAVMTKYNGKITFEAFEKDLTILKAVMNETLRLRTPAHLQNRVAAEPVTLTAADGKTYRIPKDTVVVHSYYTLFHDPKLFGSDVDRFRPERFLEMSEQHKRDYFFPFSTGPRNCIGFKFAQTEVIMTLAKILYAFELSTDVVDPEAFPTTVEFTFRPAKDIMLSIKPIKRE